jgi:hypothetical protein
MQSFTMADQAGRDGARCPECGAKATRVYNSPAAIVKTRGIPNVKLKPNQRVINRDGVPVRINVFDEGCAPRPKRGKIPKGTR